VGKNRTEEVADIAVEEVADIAGEEVADIAGEHIGEVERNIVVGELGDIMEMVFASNPVLEVVQTL